MPRRRNWIDRTRVLWRIGNRVETFQLRKFGRSPMAILNRGEVLVIETTGRKSGRQRFTPVGYWRADDGSYLVGAGAAGMSSTPDWVANLRASADAAIWIHRRRIPVVRSELVGEERDAAQRHASTIWPAVDKYEHRSGRIIPYFRLTTKD